MRFSDLVGSSFSLVFIDAACRHSKKLLRDLAAPRQPPAALPIIIACSGGTSCIDLARGAAGIGRVLIQEAGELPTLMRVPATPAAYAVGGDRRTIGALALGPQSVRKLLAGETIPANLQSSKQTGAHHTTPIRHGFLANQQVLPVGSTIPPLVITDLTGAQLLNAPRSGKWTLLLFWSSPCAPCEELTEPIQRLCQTTSELEILIVGRGVAADYRSLERTLTPFASRVRIGLQQQRTVSRALNTFRTPSAYLIAGNGAIHQPLAVGVYPVRQLIVSVPGFCEISPA